MEEELSPVYVPRALKKLPRWLDELPIRTFDIGVVPDGWYLTLLNDELGLSHPNKPSLTLSTRSITRRVKSNRPIELLKACDIRNNRSILDGFGGWGVDGLTLALRGAEVTICEQVPLVHLMQLDLARRLRFPALHVLGDLKCYLGATKSRFDVIYLDPMFPLHPKGAKSRRDMEVLAELAQPGDIDSIFDLAMRLAKARVVVKQRLKATDIALPSPDWSIKGRTVRFDVYLASDNRGVGIE